MEERTHVDLNGDGRGDRLEQVTHMDFNRNGYIGQPPSPAHPGKKVFLPLRKLIPFVM